MTDVRAEDLNEGDRLPWLEAVEDDDGGDGPSTLKLIVAVLIGLAAIGGIVGGLFWLGNRHAPGSPTGEPETIKAPEGAYKVRPAKSGGMTVQGQGDSSFAASAGADPKGRIDASKMPEAPVTGTRAPPRPRSPAAGRGAAPAQPAKPQTQIVRLPSRSRSRKLLRPPSRSRRSRRRPPSRSPHPLRPARAAAASSSAPSRARLVRRKLGKRFRAASPMSRRSITASFPSRPADARSTACERVVRAHPTSARA